MKTRIASFTILCLALAAVPARADYDNGPINGTSDAWAMSFGYIVSDSFNISSNQNVTGFLLGVWNVGTAPVTSLQWSLTSGENSGTVYGSGQAMSSGGDGGTLVSQTVSTNQYGFEIDKVTITGLSVNFGSGGTYWLNLQNAQDSSGYYDYYWDENSGVGCGGNGCPSRASESAVGTIPSESFTISGGSGGTTPEPGSFLLLASGMIGLAGVLRRKLL
jgi:PEP-CTERM motif